MVDRRKVGRAAGFATLLLSGFALLGTRGAAPRVLPTLTSATIVEYPLPRPKAFPHDPAVGPDGIVWYTDQVNSYIGRLDPATSKVTDYATPTGASGPHGIVVAPDGGVWYTANFNGRIGRLDPATGTIKEYVLPAAARDPHTPLYHEGKIWFTAQSANLYGVLDPATGQAQLFPVATPHAKPYGLVAGPDGAIWMALFGTNQIGRINPADGALRLFPLPSPEARPRRLIADAKGIVWYSDFARGQLGRLDPASGQVRDFPCPDGSGSQPYGIAIGTDRRIWYNESAKNTVVAFDPVTERTESVVIPTSGSVVRNMSVDVPRARLWLALSGTQRLGRIDLARAP
jgi:virginiamycin B lyase